MKNNPGFLNLVLHAHLPYVRHPEFDDFLEEDWFYEALWETYIPFIDMLERLCYEDIDFSITLSLSPTLCSMMEDKLLTERFLKKMENLKGLIFKEKKRLNNTAFEKSILMYEERIKRVEEIISRYNPITKAFKRFFEEKKLNLITTSATHIFMPHLRYAGKANEAQIKIGLDYLKTVFGKKPKGLWLPECGYYRGVENILEKEGIDYFFGETHCIMYADHYPKRGVYAPMFTENGVACFARDISSSKQVWSAREGYPGDSDYREFYRDVGFDAPYDYIKPYLHKDGVRRNTGLKYYKITGSNVDLGKKEPYNPESARKKAVIHAENFLLNRQKQMEYLNTIYDRQPIINALYDMELFGHWWWEGIDFLEEIIKKIEKFDMKLITPDEYLNMYPENQMSRLNESSWGWKGYGEIWLNEANDWIYRHLYEMENRMEEMAKKYKDTKDERISFILSQMARELLLAQSSDWPFIMHGGSCRQYAERREKLHINRFNHMYENLKRNFIDVEFAEESYKKDNIFPDLNWKVYAY